MTAIASKAFFIVGCTVLTLSACAPTMESVGDRVEVDEPHHLYSGNRKPPEELAQVSVVGQPTTFVEVFNGVNRRDFSVGKAFVYLLPGVNSLKVRYNFGGFYTAQTFTELVELRETLQAGHTYALHFNYTDSTKQTIRFRLVDYGQDVPRRCVVYGLAYGGPIASQFLECIQRHSAPTTPR